MARTSFAARLEELGFATYEDYLASERWKRIRATAIELAGGRCRLCNYSERLQVHHRSYERIGAERHGDVIVLCNGCHQTFHRERLVTGEPATARQLAYIRHLIAEAGVPVIEVPILKSEASVVIKQLQAVLDGRMRVDVALGAIYGTRLLARTVPCTQCGVTAGRLCRRQDGTERTTVHRARIARSRIHYAEVAQAAS